MGHTTRHSRACHRPPPALHALCAALVLFCLAGATHSGELSSPTGVWQQIDDHSGKVRTLVQIEETGGTLHGTIVKLFPNPGEATPPRCAKCADSDSRKDQPILGMVFLTGLKHESADSPVWSGGEILDPESGTVYRCKVTLSADGLTLHVRGFVGIALIGRTQTWQRSP